MRIVDALLAAALLLPAGGAFAHGLHELRGEYRWLPQGLQLTVPPADLASRDGLCLRLLDELQVRDERGVRLTATQDEEPGTGRCLLTVAVPVQVRTLTLELRPRRKGPPRSERLVLIPKLENDPNAEALILRSGGGASALSVPGHEY
jgi:hypothetical protein